MENAQGAVPGRLVIDDEAIGLATFLQGTSKPIYLLVPSYWKPSEVNSPETRAALIPRITGAIRSLSTKIQTRTGGRFTLCSRRITIVVGAYGKPYHPAPLPTYLPNGKLAGTVGGEIIALDELRQQMCR
jgi:hypothetical protein